MSIDRNHDIVPTLRMFDGLIMGQAADEIERLRAELISATGPKFQLVGYVDLAEVAHNATRQQSSSLWHRQYEDKKYTAVYTITSQGKPSNRNDALK